MLNLLLNKTSRDEAAIDCLIFSLELDHGFQFWMFASVREGYLDGFLPAALAKQDWYGEFPFNYPFRTFS